jgi:hypothetical protein
LIPFGDNVGANTEPLLLLQSDQFKQITARFEIHQEAQVRALGSGVLSHSRFFNLPKLLGKQSLLHLGRLTRFLLTKMVGKYNHVPHLAYVVLN